MTADPARIDLRFVPAVLVNLPDSGEATYSVRVRNENSWRALTFSRAVHRYQVWFAPTGTIWSTSSYDHRIEKQAIGLRPQHANHGRVGS